MITQYIDQSPAIKQSVFGQAELQYILCNNLTGVPTCQASPVLTVPRVSFPALSDASGFQIQIFTTETLLSLSWGALALLFFKPSTCTRLKVSLTSGIFNMV